MSIGPVEVMVVAFPRNRFTGAIAEAISGLVDDGTIRIIDLAFVAKDVDGNVLDFEAADLESEVGAAFAALGATGTGFLNEEDLQDAAEGLDPDTSAAILVWEDVWATPVATALKEAGAIMVARSVVPYDVVLAAAEYAASQTPVNA